jgi:hypothetical protein
MSIARLRPAAANFLLRQADHLHQAKIKNLGLRDVELVENAHAEAPARI